IPKIRFVLHKFTPFFHVLLYRQQHFCARRFIADFAANAIFIKTEIFYILLFKIKLQQNK
ncbi:MAG: hypothetical protein NWQ29_01975, partial [Alphaproteobacteria bacterium]|nr:hypothetical protein [Alphaproteobacteria bacterium]